MSGYLAGPAAALVPIAVDYLAGYVSQEIMTHMHIDAAADIGLTEFFIMQSDACAATAKTYKKAISESKTILWNGPMGVFEMDKFANGTKQVALALAEATRITTQLRY